MLPKANRIKKERDFEAIFRKGKSFRGSSLLLRIRKQERQVSRFSVVVSKKTAAKAVARNKIRRTIAEAVRKLLPSVAPGFDVVIVVLPGFSPSGSSETQNILSSLFLKAALLKV